MKINLDRTQEAIERFKEKCRIENKERSEKEKKDQNSSTGQKKKGGGARKKES